MKSRLLVLLVITYAYISGNEASAQYSRSVIATKTFTTSGTFTITDLTDISGYDPNNEIFALAEVEVLLVGGGGGGGRGNSAGGGGGGQVRVETINLNLGATLNITVGPGGSGAKQSGNNSNDGNEGTQTDVNLVSGTTSMGYIASGGKGGTGNGNGGNSGNGNSGGNGNGNGQNVKGGGGGGNGGPGTNGSGNGSSSTGGNGGDGAFVAFTGKSYGAGGGGNGRNGGSAGSGGTGNANPSGQGANASANSGSGGGAGSSSTKGGNGSDGIVVVQITYRILPVEFLYFNTTYKSSDHTATLEWATAKEWENSHFNIERAINSVKTWETIGRVEGNGYSDQSIKYNFTDINLPRSGGNIFYRLKQVDYAGKFSYSNTRSIQAEALESSDVWITYPNPSTSGSEIKIDLAQPDKYLDELIYLRFITFLGNGNTQILSSPDQISPIVSDWLRNQRTGLHIIEIRWGNNTQLIKLLRN
ncbi:glycine-rich domain-containing protein [Algoriphagus aquimarinus]|uniref:glycine-rich domain-containing protein n=1 Tax=Algoriphagus aquimarinus TaxID=237018 RepID=UPI0030D952AD|tara:strand:+ start:137433 stop:138854 length:1422 start_codon:yes stop_codon:yes gene_type:complete